MAGTVLLGALAAFGLISLAWAAFGWLLPGGKGAVLVCRGGPEDGVLWRVKWLRGLGLLPWPLLIVTEEAEEDRSGNGIEYCRPEDLLPRLEQERTESDGTGNGDPTGHHRRGGVPEL